MNYKEYLEKEKKNKLSLKIIELCKDITDDPEYPCGVLVGLNDEEKKAVISYFEKGVDVDYEQVILYTLWLKQQRELQDKD